jgi:hypothetical protein
MGGLGNLVELINVSGVAPLITASGALACSGLVAFAWRGAPNPNALPPLDPGLPLSAAGSELAQPRAASPDLGLLGVAVPGGGE